MRGMGSSFVPLAPVSIRSLGSLDGVQTTLTWKGAVSMASPEVPPHGKQAVRSLPGTRPGWENAALCAGGYNAARALVHGGLGGFGREW